METVPWSSTFTTNNIGIQHSLPIQHTVLYLLIPVFPTQSSQLHRFTKPIMRVHTVLCMSGTLGTALGATISQRTSQPTAASTSR